MKMLDEIVHEELGTEAVLSSDMKIFKLKNTDILYQMEFKTEEEANLFRLTQGIK